MNPERWQQIQNILDKAWASGPSAWTTYLDEACAGDPSLRQEVESLLQSLDAAGDFLENPFSDNASEAGGPSLIGQSFGPYRIVAELGRGGMGTVYRAVRAGDYEQQVAIKLIKRGLDTDFVLRRFRDERQILAKLQHPGIARMLDGGSTPDGLPYFVMECIEGQPLDRYCDENKLSLADRLRLFRLVCSAVEYAHRNLIVHRDIKPGNILVTSDGTPRLLDFGIAKLLNAEPADSSPPQTTTVMKMMTPDYASPEQASGGVITTATDVYSLGVVLHVLLTGALPHRTAPDLDVDEPSTAILKNDTGEDEEKLRRKLAGDLDNIVLMALREKPERRYSSVENLSEDIRRHLEGLPVAARRDTFSYRAVKFVKRHTAGVAAAVFITLTLAAGIGATLWEARVASAQRARAERRFNDVRQLAHTLMFDIYDGVKDLAGATQSRKQILDSALRYLDSLTQESGGDPALQRELASAYQRMGEVRFQQTMGNLGDTPGALESYGKSLSLRKAIAGSAAATSDDQLNLAKSYYYISRILNVAGNVAGSLKNGQQAVSILEDMRSKTPRDEKVLSALQSSYDAVGDALSSDANGSGLGRIAEAADVHQKALVLAQGRAKKYPRAVAICLIKVGNDRKKLGDRRGAIAAYYQARDILQKLAGDTTKAEPRRDVAGIASAIGDTLILDGNGKDALPVYARCLQISKDLAAADPANRLAQTDLGLAYTGVGNAFYVLGDWQSAKDNLAIAREVIGRASAHDPLDGGARDMLASLDVQIGQVDEKVGLVTQALQEYRAALAIFVASAEKDPKNIDARLNTGAACLRIAHAFARSKDFAPAAENYRKALEYVEKIATADHADERALYTAADSYSGLGEVMALSGTDTKEARVMLERSLGVWRKIPNPARLTPSGFDAGNPKEVEAAKQRLLTDQRTKPPDH